MKIKIKKRSNWESKGMETEQLNDSPEINLIINKDQLDSILRLLRTIEKIILRNNKINKHVFLKKYKDDSQRYKETVNKIDEVNLKLLDKIISDMDIFNKDN